MTEAKSLESVRSLRVMIDGTTLSKNGITIGEIIGSRRNGLQVLFGQADQYNVCVLIAHTGSLRVSSRKEAGIAQKVIHHINGKGRSIEVCAIAEANVTIEPLNADQMGHALTGAPRPGRPSKKR